MPTQYLMTFAIGPVQEFIATARRSRDLWFGSWLLSEMSKAAALAILEQNYGREKDLIFPAPENKSGLGAQAFSVVNKLVAVVRKPPDEIGEAVRKAMLKRLHELRDDVDKPFSKLPEENRQRAKAQIDDLIELFWAAIPLADADDPAAYYKAREQAEALLASRKATRDFKPVDWGDHVPKSSLDGQRESVIPESNYPTRGDSPAKRREKIHRLWRDYGVREGERLCGVGLLKRHGRRNHDDRFFSTSHVAALPLIAKLKESDRPTVTAYINALRKELLPEDVSQALNMVPHIAYPNFGAYDGRLLFENRLDEFFSDEEDGKTEGGKSPLERAKNAQRHFLEAAFGKVVRPQAYYALLLADGDRMGVAIDTSARKGSGEHRQLSRQLSKFAASVCDLVQETHKGSLVYSGGDDVLAFLPLHTVLPCARDLANKFKKDLIEFEVEEKGKTSSPTLSVGIAISHHLEPLADALRLARQAEKTAKGVDGKNALAVTLSKRSGADRTVKGSWSQLDQRLDRFVWLHRAEAIPDGAAYELHDLALRLEGVKREALNAEAMRILKRKRAEQGQQPLAEKVFDELSRFINDPNLPLEQLADELIIAREFAGATRQAGIELKDLPGASSVELPLATVQEEKP